MKIKTEQFNIRCKICGSNENKLEENSKFKMLYEDSYTDHRVYLICCHCGNKEFLFSYTTSTYV